MTDYRHKISANLQLVGNLYGSPGVEPGTASYHQTLFPGQLMADVESVLVLHLDHVVNQRKVQPAGGGAFANTFNQNLWQLIRPECTDSILLSFPFVRPVVNDSFF